MSASEESEAFLGNKRKRRLHLEEFENVHNGWPANVLSSFRYTSVFFSHFLTFIATTAIWALVWTHPFTHEHREATISSDNFLELKAPDLADSYGSFAKDARFLTCGFSIAEAQARGCEYDILSGKYLPPFCIDREAIEFYKADGSWFGYADSNRTELLTIEQMGTRDVYYTSARDHIQHCAALWRKQYQAVYEGREYIDSVIASREHTFHCAQLLVDMTDLKIDLWSSPIKVFVSAAGCFVKN